MSAEDDVINAFAEDVEQHKELIMDLLEKGKDKFEEVKLWFAELLRMHKLWFDTHQKPATVITAGTFGSGFTTTHTGDTKYLAKRRLDIITPVMKKIIKVAGDKGLELA
ncbi:hypothetical protein ACFL96_13640 [Thermoproteota archaeon]